MRGHWLTPFACVCSLLARGTPDLCGVGFYPRPNPGTGSVVGGRREAEPVWGTGEPLTTVLVLVQCPNAACDDDRQTGVRRQSHAKSCLNVLVLHGLPASCEVGQLWVGQQCMSDGGEGITTQVPYRDP
jgi:hypothetical protein